VEGRIGAIEITGNKYFRSKVIASRLADKPDDLLNIATLEEHLNRINRQMPYHLRATLTPGSETGQTDLKLNVEESQPWQISPTYDNQGRPGIGTNRLGIGVQNNSLFGYGDRLDVRYIGAVRTNLATASYSIPLNHYGTELAYYYSLGAVHPEVNQPGVDIRGLANNHSVSLSQPLDKNRNFLADVSFNARHVTTTVNDDRVGRDDVRSLSFGLSYNHPDRYGQSFVRLQTDVGPGWMGANRKFWKTQAYGTRTFQLPKNNFVLLRASGQLSRDALPPVEEYQIGGAFSVRGFSEGLLIGDRGYSGSAEWRWPIPGLAHASPWLAQRVQGAVFYDMGQVWFDSRHNGSYSNNVKRTMLIGTGLGLRAQLTRYLIGFVDFGYGISNQRKDVEPNAQPSVRVHFGIRSDLLPKTYKSRSNNVTYFNPKPMVAPVINTQ
jgi:hemolysin activation/secretion protein